MTDETKSVSISTITEGIAIIVAIGFVVSVIYDWGFVYALGLDFGRLPTTTADHFRSGLLWFPNLLGLTLAYVAIEFQFQRVERGLTEKEIINSSSNPEWMRKFRSGPSKLFIWMAPLYVLIYLLIGDAYASMLPLMLSIAWMGFAEWCHSAPLIKLRRSREIQRGFMFLPIVGILAFFSGYNAAIDATVRKPSEVIIERVEPLAPVSGNVLRTFEKGILLLGEGHSIRFLPWDQVRAIQNKTPYEPFRGVLCAWFSVCQPQPVAPSNTLPNKQPSSAPVAPRSTGLLERSS